MKTKCVKSRSTGTRLARLRHRAQVVEQTYTLARQILRPILRVIESLVLPGDRVLELNAKTAWAIRQMNRAGFRVAIEPDEDFAFQSKLLSRYGVRVVQDRAQLEPTEKFDVIFRVHDHPVGQKLLTELSDVRSLLSPRGRVVLVQLAPWFERLLSLWVWMRTGVRPVSFTSATVESILKDWAPDVGFRIALSWRLLGARVFSLEATEVTVATPSAESPSAVVLRVGDLVDTRIEVSKNLGLIWNVLSSRSGLRVFVDLLDLSRTLDLGRGRQVCRETRLFF